MDAVETVAAGPLVNVSRVSLTRMGELPDSVLTRALQRVRDEFAVAEGGSGATEAGRVRVPVAAFNSSFSGRG